MTITAQRSMKLAQNAIDDAEDNLARTPSESTFTRHTKSIHAVIKEIILGFICVLQLYLTIKLTKG